MRVTAVRILILDRYILREFLWRFLLGVGAFSGLLFSIDQLRKLINLAVEHGVSMLLIAELAVLRLPAVLTLSFPMATLMGALWAFGQLSETGEMVAGFAAGLSLRKLARSVLAFSLLLSAFTLFFNEYIATWCWDTADRLERTRVAPSSITQRRLHVVFVDVDRNTDRPLLSVYAEEFDPSDVALRHIVLTKFEYPEGYDEPPRLYIVHADEARYEGDGMWRLINAIGEECFTDKPIRAVESEIRIMRTPQEIERSQRELGSLSIGELRGWLKGLQAGSSQWVRAQISRAATELHTRFAIGFACFVFACLGIPMGTRPQRTSGQIAMGLSIVIIFVYYVVMYYLTVMGQQGRLPPVVAAWSANVITFFISAALMMRAPQ